MNDQYGANGLIILFAYAILISYKTIYVLITEINPIFAKLCPKITKRGKIIYHGISLYQKSKQKKPLKLKILTMNEQMGQWSCYVRFEGLL